MTSEVEELEALYKVKELYKWSDDSADFKKRLKALQKKYGAKAAPSGKDDDDDKPPPPRFTKWETVKVVKAADFEAAYKKLGEVEKATWVPDKWARGSIMNFQGEKGCAWRRRMSKDGEHFARVVNFSGGFALQKGIKAGTLDEADSDDSDDDGGAPKGQEEPEVAAAPVPSAARGKRQVVSSGATAKDKKDKGQGSSSQDTPAPEEPPAKRNRKAAKK